MSRKVSASSSSRVKPRMSRRALVHAQPASTWIDVVDAHRRVLERGAEAFLGLAQRLGFLLRGADGVVHGVVWIGKRPCGPARSYLRRWRGHTPGSALMVDAKNVS